MRVVGGRLRGRRLSAVPDGVRPTSDRVREAVFSALGEVSGARVLDLYAGSGALGIEALSRGAESATFVERSARVRAVLQRNLAALGLEDRARVVAGEARRRLRALRGADPVARFDLVFVDPPYDSGEIEPVLAGLLDADLLDDRAEVVVESATRHPWSPPPGLAIENVRRYGDTTITRLSRRRGGAGDASDGGAESRPMPVRHPTRALFPASFDPLTNGHLDLIRRAHKVFDEVVVAVAHNVDKRGGTFSVDERLEILHQVLDGLGRVRIDSFSGLLVDYARRIEAHVIIRGLRAMSDFEYEFEMALMNKHLNPDIEIMFMMTSQENLYVSSSRLKELTAFGASIDEWVPSLVAERLRDKLA